MAHHLVRYLKHARRELLRALDGLDPTAVDLRLGGLNSPTWIVGHLTQQEQRLFLTPRGEPEVADLSPYGSGAPVMLEPLHDIETLLEFKRAVAEAVDPWLDTLTAEDLLQHLPGGGLFERGECRFTPDPDDPPRLPSTSARSRWFTSCSATRSPRSWAPSGERTSTSRSRGPSPGWAAATSRSQ